MWHGRVAEDSSLNMGWFSIATMWDPRWIEVGEQNSSLTMVYDTQRTIVFIGFIKQFLTKGPHIVC